MHPPEPIIAGTNRVYVDEDLVTWVCGASVQADDLRLGNQIFESVLDKYGYVLILSRIDELGSMDAEARRVHTEWHKSLEPRFSAAVVGGGLVARALVRLILTAAQLVTRGSRMRFDSFESEAQALAWLASERTRLRALAAAASPSEPE